MAQNRFDTDLSDSGSGSGTPGADDDSCGAAVMAAMRAISDYCEEDGVPHRLDNGMVVMVPKEEMDRVRNMDGMSMDDMEVREMIDTSPWLAEFVADVCSGAGLSDGSSEREECELRYARMVLG